MSSIFYKVVFRGISEMEETPLSLTFNNVLSDKYINMTHYITSIKNINDLHENMINFQNIEDVIIMGANSHLLSFNYYIVILILKQLKLNLNTFINTITNKNVLILILN